MERKIEPKPIAIWLKKHHKTTRWLALQVDVSYTSAHSWVQGLTSPTLKHARRLMELTNLTLEQLTD